MKIVMRLVAWKKFRFDPNYLAGLCNLDVDPNNPKEAHHSNPMNFDIRVTPNGSMEKQHFLDWSHHFVRNLPESQKGKIRNPYFSLSTVMSLTRIWLPCDTSKKTMCLSFSFQATPLSGASPMIAVST
eukprot:scaffold28980_cov98-Attheya_sp.AAC.2